jgi:hypothetical protein
MSTKHKGGRISNYQKEEYDDYRSAYEDIDQVHYQQDRGSVSQQSGYQGGGGMGYGSRAGELESEPRQRKSVRKDLRSPKPWESPPDDSEE